MQKIKKTSENLYAKTGNGDSAEKTNNPKQTICI
jgi:hypothetical protein